MTWTNLPLQQMKLAFAATMTLVGFMSDPPQVQAQTAISVASTTKQVASRFVPPPPPDRGAPGQRKGAASRGGASFGACASVEKPLTALVPVTKTLGGSQGGTSVMSPSESVWGLTVVEHPTFWFYVPYSLTSLRSVEFVLQDEKDNDVYRTPVTPPEMAGIVSLRLPPMLTPLLIGKRYHWFFKIKIACAPKKQFNVKDYVEGWVQRVTLSPTLTRQLKAATPQQRIALYAKNGIWHDALTTLAELRLVAPEDATLKADWNDLLQSAGLAYIASQPIVQCCSFEKFTQR